jgi:UDP-2,4-diacetamido-2,4,6-trideoxy-beta-L-altropyranose hydrolase
MNSTDRLLKLRNIKHDDCKLLWQWANDPVVRKSSFSSEAITWEEHLKWFTNKLNSPNCYQFIGLNSENEPVGQIRFDIDSQLQAEVDISIDSNKRGKGYAIYLIKLSISHLFRNTNVEIVNAIIKSENIASIKLFSKSGFECINQKIIDSFHVYHYVCKK